MIIIVIKRKKRTTKGIATNFIYTLFGGNSAILQRTTWLESQKIMLFYIKFYLYYFRENFVFFFRCYLFSCAFERALKNISRETRKNVTNGKKNKITLNIHNKQLVFCLHSMVYVRFLQTCRTNHLEL